MNQSTESTSPTPPQQDCRPGEDLNLDRLQPYLSAHADNLGQLQRVRQFRSGYSNLTYLIVGEHGQAVLRRPPFGPRSASAHDMAREFGILSGLAAISKVESKERIVSIQSVAAKPSARMAPYPLLLCEDEDILGAPFYLMEYVEGEIIRLPASGGGGTAPAQVIVEGPDQYSLTLTSGVELSVSDVKAASRALISTLARLHDLPLDATAFSHLGRPDGYVARQVEGWIGRYERAQTPNVPVLGELAVFLREQQPPDRPGVLVHNDYKFDNVIFATGDFSRVACVLDWEMCTVGNDLMDFGLTLAYWAHAEEVAAMPFLGMNATHLPGFPRRPELVELYLAARGFGESEKKELPWHFVFGNIKIAGIVQQIYARYVAGHTQDARFKGLGQVVNYLLQRARTAMAEHQL